MEGDDMLTNQEISRMLRSYADEAVHLAESLEEDGTVPLDKMQQSIVRAALLPAVEELTDMIKIAFLKGERWQREEERLQEYITFSKEL
jgi:hypothetical protein